MPNKNKKGAKMPILIFFLIIFLAGCHTATPPIDYKEKSQHTYKPTKKDGAPRGPVPVNFQKVKPKLESFSRYGNPGAYAVNGRTYEVMRTSGGYKTKGIASWYGTKFHKQRTSSGDNYDMYAMTAAHRTLPLPTYVRVKNLNNGREAVVKVNDRGPFHSDRIIDLSYAAATKLGLMPKGTAPVEIEALMSGSKMAYYYIQAGAFSSEQLASALKQKLIKVTPSPVFIEKFQQRYIVRVGPFAEKKMTEKIRTQLASLGVKGAFSILK
jgi:rare lipoprotein A